jgi:hypothetical protein
MGVDKTGDSNKEYAAGYTDGFAAGIAAGFSATNKLQIGLSVPDTNVVMDSSTAFVAAETKAEKTKTAEIIAAEILADIDINSVVETHADQATETELDFDFLHARSNAFEPPARAIKFEQDAAHPLTVTEEELGHLAPGCFVQVGSGDTSYWVEVGQIEGTTISGMVHPELSGSLCVVDHDSCEVARFSRDQITALGCDRYCWC